MLHLSYTEVKDAVKALADAVRTSGYAPDYLIGITVGGLIPLALIAKELETQNVGTISASSYEGHERKGLTIRALPDVDLKDQSILLVDDISDTGETLREVSTLLKERYAVRDVKTAVVVIRKDKDTHRPDFHAIESDEWVVFPWEKDTEG